MTPRAFFTASVMVTAGMMGGRILGLLREMLIASQFGAGPDASFAIILLMLPDFFTGALLGGTAISAVLLPAFAERNDEDILALCWQSALLCAGFFATIALLLALQAETLVSFFAEGTTFHYASSDLRLVLCSLPVAALTWVLVAYLQHRQSFAAFSVGTLGFNAVIVSVLWLAGGSMLMLSIAIVLGIMARLIIHLISFAKHGGRWVNPLANWQLQKPLLLAYGSTLSSNILSFLPQYIPYAVIAASGSSLRRTCTVTTLVPA